MLVFLDVTCANSDRPLGNGGKAESKPVDICGDGALCILGTGLVMLLSIGDFWDGPALRDVMGVAAAWSRGLTRGCRSRCMYESSAMGY